MSKDILIDYAYPMMMAERKLKDAHDAFLEKDYDVGIERLIEVAAEVKLALTSAKHMKEQRDALRQQTQTV
jgi:hypothetical protein